MKVFSASLQWEFDEAEWSYSSPWNCRLSWPGTSRSIGQSLCDVGFKPNQPRQNHRGWSFERHRVIHNPIRHSSWTLSHFWTSRHREETMAQCNFYARNISREKKPRSNLQYGFWSFWKWGGQVTYIFHGITSSSLGNVPRQPVARATLLSAKPLTFAVGVNDLLTDHCAFEITARIFCFWTIVKQ